MSSESVLRIRTHFSPQSTPVPGGDLKRLHGFFRDHERVAVLTGAGCSTGSGIPAYRDEAGQWQRNRPIFHQDFLRDDSVRRRYWARSFAGWPTIGSACPNAAHEALARLEQGGFVQSLVTQNVDGLHGAAGQRELIELHGALQRVQCLECGTTLSRAGVQEQLAALNPSWSPALLRSNPDGDAELTETAYGSFRIPDCQGCGGILKPDVVFFGGSVPPDRAAAARRAVLSANAVLVVGSSLAVWSALRIVREAAAAGLPIAAINEGRTRADALLQFKLGGRCESQLNRLSKKLTGQ